MERKLSFQQTLEGVPEEIETSRMSVKEFIDQHVHSHLKTTPRPTHTEIPSTFPSEPQIYWHSIPADLKLAKKAAERQPFKDNAGKELNLRSSVEEISKHSVSYDIYFKLHPLLLKIWMIIIVTSIVTEVLGFLYCTSPDIPDLISFREYFSITVRCEESIFLIAMKIAVMTLGSIVILFLIHSIRKQLAQDFDVPLKKNIKSEAQFCLLLKGLPQGTNEKELKGWIASFFSEKIEIRGILFIRSPKTLYQRISMIKKHNSQKGSKSFRSSERDADSVPLMVDERKEDAEEIHRQASYTSGPKLDREIEEHLKHPSDSNSADFTGAAIVCFESVKDRAQVLEFFTKSKNRAAALFKSNKITFEAPPEPHNVDWANIHRSATVRTISKAAAWFFLILIWGATLGAIYGYYIELAASGDTELFKIMINVLYIICLKQLVDGIIVLFAKLIRFHSAVSREAYKFHLRLIFNYLAFTVSQLAYILNNFQNAGKAFTLSSLALFLIFLVNPLYAFIIYCYRKFRRWRLDKQGDKNNVTQEEAIQYYKNPEFDLLDRVSDISLAYYMALSLSPLFPFVAIITFAVYGFGYAIDKYLILKFYSYPSYQMFRTSIKSYQIFIFTCLLQTLGVSYYLATVLAERNKQADENEVDIGRFAKGVMIALLPILFIYYMLFYKSSKTLRRECGLKDELPDLPYKAMQESFFSTYWEYYPYRSEKENSF